MSLVPYADDDVTMGDDPQPGDDEGDDAGAVAAQPMQVSPQGKGVFEIQMADGPIALENKTIIVDHGSLVGFDKNAEHFTAMLVAVVDGEFTVKRLSRTSTGMILAAEHPEYPPIAISSETDVRIWGVVTWVLHQP